MRIVIYWISFFAEIHRKFTLCNNYKPLTFSPSSSLDKYSSRASRQLNYIPQFTPDIQYISGVYNLVAESLSRIIFLNSFQRIDFLKLAQIQTEDIEFQHKLSSITLKLQIQQIKTCGETVLREKSTGRDHLVMPKHHERNIFNTLHEFSNLGVRATMRLIDGCLWWHDMNKDVR